MDITIIGIFKKYEISYIHIDILLKYTAITLKKEQILVYSRYHNASLFR